MVMEVVPECLDVRDALLPPLGGEMAWEKDFVGRVSCSLEERSWEYHRKSHSRALLSSSWLTLARSGVPEVVHCDRGLVGRFEWLVFERRQTPTASSAGLSTPRGLPVQNLQEDFPEYPIRLLTEDGAEYNGYSVMTRFDIDGFLLPIMNRHHLSAFRNAFRSGLPRIFRGLLLQLGEFIESSFEGRGHGVALEKRYPAN